MKLEFGFRQEPAEEAIKRFEEKLEAQCRQDYPNIKVEDAVRVKMMAGVVSVPRKAEVTLFGRTKTFTRMQEFQTGP